jgi:putative ABC transport system permease protein
MIQDLRYAARMLRKSPGFATVAILTLGLGIGGNTAIFSFVDNVLLKPLPYPEPDRILRVLQRTPQGRLFGITTLDFLDWQKQNTVFEDLAAQTGWSATLTNTSGGDPMFLQGIRVSPAYFNVNGVKPALGRTFLPEEDQYGKDRVVVLSNALWVSQFGADRGIIGRIIRLNNDPFTVIGVMPPGSVFDRTDFQIMKPMAFSPAEMTRGFHWFGAFAKLKPGVTLEQARNQMNGLAAQYSKAYPDTNNGFGIAVDRFENVLVGRQLRSSLYVLLAAAGMVLLIGCANLANLTLARALSREREIAVRAALGAGRGRLVWQFLTENVLLAVAGGAFGVGLGYLTMRWLRFEIPVTTLPAEANIQLDGRVLLFALALSILTGLLFGLAPALQVTRPDLGGTMKEGGRGSTSSRHWLRGGLVAAEVTIAFMLLAGAGLLIRSFFDLQNVDLGFDSKNVLTMSLPTAASQFPNLTQLNNYLREVRRAVESVPGVREAAFTGGLPLQGASYGLPMQLEGTPPVDRPHRGFYFYKVVSPSYFHTLGIRVLKGRALDEHDTKGAPLAAVINERLAKQLFPKGDPLGHRILIPETLPGQQNVGDDLAFEIVGVIGNEKVFALNDATAEGVYVSMEQSPFYNPSLAVLTSVDPLTLARPIRQAVDRINKSQAISEVKTMERIKAESIATSHLQTVLLATFSGIALLLAAIGIYGVISYTVTERTREMGIRAALGASSGSLLKLVLGSGLALTGIGLLVGFAGSLALTRLLQSLLFGVEARDPLTMALVAVTLVLVALLACYIPARRASRVDPATALRYE